jgi:hypothetical protein
VQGSPHNDPLATTSRYNVRPQKALVHGEAEQSYLSNAIGASQAMKAGSTRMNQRRRWLEFLDEEDALRGYI